MAFNATKTACGWLHTMAGTTAAADDLLECAASAKLNPDDVAGLYGKLSSDIHTAGACVDSLKEPNGLLPNEVLFLLCVAHKRFGL